MNKYIFYGLAALAFIAFVKMWESYNYNLGYKKARTEGELALANQEKAFNKSLSEIKEVQQSNKNQFKDLLDKVTAESLNVKLNEDVKNELRKANRTEVITHYKTEFKEIAGQCGLLPETVDALNRMIAK